MSIKRVFISSTSYDLKEYRQVAIETCIKLGSLPIAMEFFESTDEDAVDGSKKKLSKADIYIGILAHRYGYIPTNGDKSVTEIEYDYARELGLPCLMFVVDPNTLWKIEHVDTDLPNKDCLKNLKQRIMKESIVNFFSSPEDFQAKLALSLIYKILAQSEDANSLALSENQRRYGQVLITPGFGMPSHDEAYQGDIYASLPNGIEYEALFTVHLAEVATELYIEAKRWIDLPKHAPGTGVSSMWSAIFGCRIFIADCTGCDPLVFYELGIARTVGKPIILISQNTKKYIPQGFSHFRIIEYENSTAGLEKLRDDLKQAITHLVIN